MSNLRELILQSDDIPVETITVKQWGGVELEIRGMNGKERAKLLRGSMSDEGELDFEKLYPLLIVACSYDPETGDKVFTEADLDLLNSKSGAALETVGQVCARLSGMDKKDVDDLGKP